MALVRCTCVTSWSRASAAGGRPALDVQVLDPGCGYVVHRAFSDLAQAPGPGDGEGDAPPRR